MQKVRSHSLVAMLYTSILLGPNQYYVNDPYARKWLCYKTLFHPSHGEGSSITVIMTYNRNYLADTNRNACHKCQSKLSLTEYYR